LEILWARSFEFCISPLTAAVWGFDKLKFWLPQKLEEKFKNTPKENLQIPPKHLAIPVLQRLVYTDNEKLREMFVNLLANSMDKATKDKAHSSFVEIISQINPDEAKLLQFLTTQEIFPKIDIRVFINEKGNYLANTSIYNLSLFGKKAKLEKPELCSIYFENFSRLGLFNIINDKSYVDKSCYKELEDALNKVPEILNLKAKLLPNQKLEYKKGMFEPTNYGKLFMEVVTGKI
jgi:Abortive infection alpha